ncbi:MAG: hypothetical protein ACREFX_13650 [Opitutaceae bacterium]
MTKRDPAPAARPVGLFTIVAIFASFAIFLAIVLGVYRPTPAALPYNVLPDNMAKDEIDTATPQARLAYLHALRARHAEQLASYSWRNPNKKDIVRIPIERAMELIVKEYGK